ncbi:hypothetical protein MTO96_038548 [Rhipicephalus appendiculatus]
MDLRSTEYRPLFGGPVDRPLFDENNTRERILHLDYRSCNCSFCFDYIYSCILLLCPATMWKAHLLCTLHTLPLFRPCNADPLVQRRRS